MPIDYIDEVRAARVRHRINQAHFGKGAGLAIQTVVDLERHRVGIDAETYGRLLAVVERLAQERRAA